MFTEFILRSLPILSFDKICLLTVALCISSGQYCFAMFARSLSPPWALINLLTQAVTNVYFALAFVSYGVGLFGYLYLLRKQSIVEANFSILGLILCLSVGFSVFIGDSLTPIQWFGATLIGIGLILLQGIG